MSIHLLNPVEVFQGWGTLTPSTVNILDDFVEVTWRYDALGELIQPIMVRLFAECCGTDAVVYLIAYERRNTGAWRNRWNQRSIASLIYTPTHLEWLSGRFTHCVGENSAECGITPPYDTRVSLSELRLTLDRWAETAETVTGIPSQFIGFSETFICSGLACPPDFTGWVAKLPPPYDQTVWQGTRVNVEIDLLFELEETVPSGDYIRTERDPVNGDLWFRVYSAIDQFFNPIGPYELVKPEYLNCAPPPPPEPPITSYDGLCKQEPYGLIVPTPLLNLLGFEEVRRRTIHDFENLSNNEFDGGWYSFIDKLEVLSPSQGNYLTMRGEYTSCNGQIRTRPAFRPLFFSDDHSVLDPLTGDLLFIIPKAEHPVGNQPPPRETPGDGSCLYTFKVKLEATLGIDVVYWERPKRLRDSNPRQGEQPYEIGRIEITIPLGETVQYARGPDVPNVVLQATEELVSNGASYIVDTVIDKTLTFFFPIAGAVIGQILDIGVDLEIDKAC